MGRFGIDAIQSSNRMYSAERVRMYIQKVFGLDCNVQFADDPMNFNMIVKVIICLRGHVLAVSSPLEFFRGELTDAQITEIASDVAEKIEDDFMEVKKGVSHEWLVDTVIGRYLPAIYDSGTFLDWATSTLA